MILIHVPSGEFLKILGQIMLEFKSTLTVEYLEGKIQQNHISYPSSPKRKHSCKLLLPYFDWYLQGL